MNPTAEGISVYDATIEAFARRFNRSSHTLGSLKARWRILERGDIGIRMRVEFENDRPVSVCSEVYFLKKRRNGNDGIPKFCAQSIGIRTESMPSHHDSVGHSRAGRANIAYTNSADVIHLVSLSERKVNHQ